MQGTDSVYSRNRVTQHVLLPRLIFIMSEALAPLESARSSEVLTRSRVSYGSCWVTGNQCRPAKTRGVLGRRMSFRTLESDQVCAIDHRGLLRQHSILKF